MFAGDDKPLLPLLARIHQACLHCFKLQSPEVNLQRCSRCRRVSYCGAECQKRDYKSHKKFCAAYQSSLTFMAALRPPTLPAHEDPAVLNRRAAGNVMEHSRYLLAKLSRPLTATEDALVAWVPRCLACAGTEEDVRAASGGGTPIQALIPCVHCKLSFYCSDAHRDLAQHAHQDVPDPDAPDGLSQCAMNRAIRAVEVMRARTGNDVEHPGGWAPPRTMVRWESLAGRTWASEYGDILKHALERPEEVDEFLRFNSEGLTYTMTILWALEKMNKSDGWTRKSSLTIHIIGASDKEVWSGFVLEEILHRLPLVKTLNLVLCGPAVPLMTRVPFPIRMGSCVPCADGGRVQIHYKTGSLYHEFAKEQGSSFAPPDLAVAFNSECGTEDDLDWYPTIQLLVNKKVPTIFTASSRRGAEADRKLLIAAGARLLPDFAGRNPWGSSLVQIEPCAVKGFYANNGYVAGAFIG